MFDSDKALAPAVVAIGGSVFGYMAFRGKHEFIHHEPPLKHSH